MSEGVRLATFTISMISSATKLTVLAGIALFLSQETHAVWSPEIAGLPRSNVGMLDTIGLIAAFLVLIVLLFRTRRATTETCSHLDPTAGPLRFQRTWIKSHELKEEALKQFVEQAKRSFLLIMAAWSEGDLTPAKDLLYPQIYDVLERRLSQMRFAETKSRFEGVAFQDVQVVEQYECEGLYYVVVHFQGTALNYVLDQTSSRIIQGSPTEPSILDETWTFVKMLGVDEPWRVIEIEISRSEMRGLRASA